MCVGVVRVCVVLVSLCVYCISQCVNVVCVCVCSIDVGVCVKAEVDVKCVSLLFSTLFFKVGSLIKPITHSLVRLTGQ